jgi:hypothetical protein
MKRSEELSDWVYSKDPRYVDQDEKSGFYSEVICYRFLKKHPSLKAISTVYWIPQSKKYFGVIFDGDRYLCSVYRVEGDTFESVKIKVDLKLVEMKYNVNIF